MSNHRTGSSGGTHLDIITLVARARDFRRVVATHEHVQLVTMVVQPGEDVGLERHDVDQVLVFVDGEANAILGEDSFRVGPGSLVIVPAGVAHNFVATGSVPLRLYTIYAPPEEPAGLVHRTKADALADPH